MRIEKLELSGYIRLMLKNIQHFVYTPESPHQIILGRNGSGKSSVLHELSPLPADIENQYAKDGFKRITLTHKGSFYVLESRSKRHSFLKDGEEQNPGGTITVQRDLVKRIFNYTPALHQLMIGVSRFSRMAAPKRREWITSLDALDHTFALKVFSKSKTLARDHQGALKNLRFRITQETNKLKALAEDEGLEARSELLGHELNILLSERIPNVAPTTVFEQKIDGLLERIKILSLQFLKQHGQLPRGLGFHDEDQIRVELLELEKALSTTQSLLVRSTNEYHELETIVQEFTKDSNLSVENLADYIQTCEQDLDAARAQLGVFFDLSMDADLIQRDTEQILDLVMQIFSQLPDNGDRRYSRETAEQAKLRIRAHEKTISHSKLRVEQIEARIQSMLSAKDTQCPRCSYVWREGFSESELEQHQTWLSEHNDIIELEQGRINKEEAFLEESSHYADLYMQFRSYVTNYPRLQPFWQYLLQNNLLLNQPSQQQHAFHQWRHDVQVSCRIQELERKHASLVELSGKQSLLDSNVHIAQRFERLHQEVQEWTTSTAVLQTKVKTLRSFQERVKRLFEIVEQVETEVYALEQAKTQHVDAIKNQHIDNVVRHHQLELANITHRIADKRTLEGVVLELESSERQVDVDQQVYALITKALSPEDGLIAEQLSGFIGCLVGQLNSIINAIWTYELNVLPCGLGSGDLDYIFPMRVENADSLVPDISEGSESIQWVVDFAFALTAMLYLDMEDYPLYLDEPGHGFDAQHSVNLVGFIKQLMDSGRFSQLFMISHFDAVHGAFTNAQTLVLDEANIAVPHAYNEHVVMH